MKKALSGIALGLVFTGGVSAGDLNDRAGLYVSLGAGFTPMYSQEVLVDGIPQGTYSDTPINTSFKLGGFFNPSFALYYVNDVNWYSDDQGNSLNHALTGVGGSVYFGSNSDQTFLFALGASTYMDRMTGDAFTGSAFMLGIGSAVNDRLSVDLKLSGHSEDTFNGVTYSNLEISSTTLAFTLNYNWY